MMSEYRISDDKNLTDDEPKHLLDLLEQARAYAHHVVGTDVSGYEPDTVTTDTVDPEGYKFFQDMRKTIQGDGFSIEVDHIVSNVGWDKIVFGFQLRYNFSMSILNMTTEHNYISLSAIYPRGVYDRIKFGYDVHTKQEHFEDFSGALLQEIIKS